MGKRLIQIIGTGLVLGITTLGIGCANIAYRTPVDKFIWDNIPSGLVPHSIKEKQEEKNIDKYRGADLNPFKVIMVVNLESKEKTRGMGYYGWPSFIDEIESLQKGKDKFPEKGYKVFKFESSDPAVNGRCIESFKVIYNDKEGYETIYDDAKSSCLREEIERTQSIKPKEYKKKPESKTIYF